MALKQNTFEGGTTGTSITTGTSGGANGDAFNLVTASGTGPTRVWSDAQAAHGALSALLNTTGAGTIQFVWNMTAATSVAVREYVRFSALPGGSTALLMVYPSSGAPVATIYLDAAGKLFVQDATATRYTMPSALSLNTWYRVELVVVRGTTTTDGALTFTVYAGDSTTALASYTASNLNTGTSAVTYANVQLGLPGGTSGAYSLHMDSVAYDEGSTALIGPAAVPNTSPTASAGADQADVEPWSTVTLTGTDSDSDGTIASRSWAQTGGSPTVTLTGAGATRTFEAPGTIAGTTLAFEYAVTDDDGATGTDTMTVTVLPVTERAVIGGVEVPMRIIAV